MVRHMTAKTVFVIIGCILLAFGARYAYISLLFLKKQTGEARGFRVSCEHQRNVYKGGKSGRWYSHWVKCAFLYQVSGEEYTVSCERPGKPCDIRKTVWVVYLKKYPKFAYIKDLSFPWQYIVAPMLLVFGALFLACGIGM